MPNRQSHLVMGLAVGTSAGLVATSEMSPEERAVEVVFAAIGGALGGIAPDILEPATSPHHRSEFHSLVLAGALVSLPLADWVAHCRAEAAASEARIIKYAHAQDNGDRLKAFAWRAFAGLITGFVAGYVSHLAMDLTTARGLPFLSAASQASGGKPAW